MPFFPKADHRQQLRLQRLAMVIASSLLTIAITLLVAWFGYIPYPVAIRYAAMVFVLIIFFYLFFRSGFNLRFSDASLIAAQVIAAGLATSYVVFEGNTARPTFIFFYLAAYMFGVFVLKTRALVLLALFYLACYAGVVWLSAMLRPSTTDLHREIFRFVLLGMMLAWLIMLGRYIRGLRESLKAANADVMRLHRMQRLIFDTATVGIAHLRDRKIIDCNVYFLTMFGYAREEVINQPTRMLYADDESWELTGNESYPELREGHTVRREIILRTKSGVIITCDFSIESLFPKEPDRGVVLMLNDISAIKEQDAALRQALLLQLAIFNHAPVGIIFIRNRIIEDCNEYMTTLLGETCEEIVGKTTERWFLSHERWEVRGHEMYSAIASGQPITYEEEFVRKDGTRFWCRVRGGLIDASDPSNATAVFVIADITDRKRAEAALRESREQLVLVIRAAQSGIWDYNLVDKQIVFSRRFLEILGFPYTAQSVELMPIIERVHDEDRARMVRVFREHIRRHVPVQEEFRLQCANGEFVWVRGNGQAIWDETGRAIRFVGSITEISDSKRQEEEIRRLAFTDSLTGLPNRRLLEDRLSHALTASRRDGQMLVVMLLDLDGFKAINDSHGHEAGDIVLKAVAERLRMAVRASDTVARMGGDEFVILIEDSRDMNDARVLAEKLLASLQEPIMAGDYRFQIGVSIGISSSPADSDQPTQLIRMADKAMYKVKESGRNNYCFHSEQK